MILPTKQAIKELKQKPDGKRHGILRPDERVELIRGDLLQISAIGPRHQAAVIAANRAFVSAVGDRALVSPQGVVLLDRFSAPQPDFALLQPRKDAYSHKHPGPADVILIIEVADSSLEYYSDPSGDSYRTVREFHRGDIVAPLLLQDCPLGLGALLPQ